MKYYSQTNQDKYLDENIFRKMENGTFLDIGAHDGKTFSNTYFFEKERGWTGICVEPIPSVYEKLEKNRSCILVNGCISDSSDKEIFLKISGYSEMLSGIAKNYNQEHLQRIEREIKEYGGNSEEISVQCYRINDLLKKHNFNTIDYCSIDVEGSELEILKSIDFKKANIRVLTVENNYNNEDFKKYMNSQGYKLKIKLGADELYVKRRRLKDLFKWNK